MPSNPVSRYGKSDEKDIAIPITNSTFQFLDKFLRFSCLVLSKITLYLKVNQNTSVYNNEIKPP